MKFYYNGKLVRTSKNHEYRFGVYNKARQGMASCHSTRELAEKTLQTFINEPLHWIENDKRAIQAIKDGKAKYCVKEGNREYMMPLGNRNKVEIWEQYIKDNQVTYEYRKNNYCVVELEAR